MFEIRHGYMNKLRFHVYNIILQSKSLVHIKCVHYDIWIIRYFPLVLQLSCFELSRDGFWLVPPHYKKINR